MWTGRTMTFKHSGTLTLLSSASKSVASEIVSRYQSPPRVEKTSIEKKDVRKLPTPATRQGQSRFSPQDIVRAYEIVFTAGNLVPRVSLTEGVALQFEGGDTLSWFEGHIRALTSSLIDQPTHAKEADKEASAFADEPPILFSIDILLIIASRSNRSGTKSRRSGGTSRRSSITGYQRCHEYNQHSNIITIEWHHEHAFIQSSTIA